MKKKSNELGFKGRRIFVDVATFTFHWCKKNETGIPSKSLKFNEIAAASVLSEAEGHWIIQLLNGESFEVKVSYLFVVSQIRAGCN